MKDHGSTLELSSGRMLADASTVGISDELKLDDAYGDWLRIEDGGIAHEKLTSAERAELADFMIARWRAFKGDAAAKPVDVDLTIEEINALPEVLGWWPCSMNDRLVRVIRAAARAGAAKFRSQP